MKQRMLGRLGIAAAVTIGSIAAASAASANSGGTALPENPQLTLVHGVPGLAVDIYLNGKKIANDVTYTAQATVSAPAGNNTVALKAANAKPSDPALLSRSLWLRKHQSKSVVAHLTEAGSAKLTVFPNDQSPTGSNARVTVRHTAQAPAVDVIANNSIVLFDGLRNPRQGKADVPAGTYNVKVVADADNSIVALPNTPLTLKAKTNTIVYAVGSLAGGTFTVIPQVLPTR